MRAFKGSLLFLGGTALLAGAGFASILFFIGPGGAQSPLSHASYFRAEPASPNQPALSDILALPDSKWKPLKGPTANFGYTHDTIWLRFRLSQLSPNRTDLLVSQFPSLKKERVVIVQNGDVVRDYLAGSEIDPQKKPVPHYLNVYPLDLSSQHPVDVYVGLLDGARKLSHIELLTAAQFQRQDGRETFAQVAILGFYLFLVLIKLGLAVRYRTLQPLLYILHLCLFSSYFALRLGMGKAWLPSQWRAYDELLTMVFGYLAVAGLQAIWYFTLEMKKTTRWWRHWVRAGMIFGVTTAILGLVLWDNPAASRSVEKITLPLAFLFNISLFFSAPVYLRHNYRPAVFLLSGLTMNVFSIGYFVTVLLGVSHFQYELKVIIPAAVAIESLFFVVAVYFKFSDATDVQRIDAMESHIGGLGLQIVQRLNELLTNPPANFYPEKADLKTLATHLNVRPDQLSAAVNRYYGYAISNLVNKYRIRTAARLLVEQPGKTILDVAMECGFSAKSNFNRVFKQETGLTPSEYRRNPTIIEPVDLPRSV